MLILYGILSARVEALGGDACLLEAIRMRG